MKRNTNIFILIQSAVRFLFFIVLVLLISAFSAASQTTDNKQTELSKSDRINHYLDLANEYARIGNDSASLYLKRAKALNSPVFDSLAYKRAEYISAVIFLRTNVIDSAAYYFQRGMEPLADSSNRELLLRCMNGMANIYFSTGSYLESLELLLEIERKSKAWGNSKIAGMVVNNLGNIYQAMGDYEKAGSYFLEAAKMSNNQGDTINYITNLNNIGIFYRDMGQYDKSYEYHKKALALSNERNIPLFAAVTNKHLGELYIQKEDYAEAVSYLQMALKTFKAQDSPNETSSVYLNLGHIAYQRENYKEAYEYYAAAEYAAAGYAESDTYTKVMLNKGRVAAKLNMYAEAKNYLHIVEELSVKQHQITLLAQAYPALAELYAQVGDYSKAYEYQQKYSTLKEDMFNKTLSETIAKEEALYQLEVKNKDIELLESKQEINEMELEHQEERLRLSRIYLMVAGIILILVIVAGIMAYRFAMKNKRSNERLKLKNRIIQEQNNEITQQNEEIRAQTDQLFYANKELKQYETALKNTNNAVVIMDAYGEFLWVNNGFTKLYGMTKQEFRNKNLNIFEAASVASNAAEIKQKVLSCIENKTTESYEFQADGANNKLIWVQTTITPLLNENGQLENLIAIDSDITAIKKYEFKLEKTNKKIIEQKARLQKQNMEINSAIRYAGTIQKAILPEPDYIHRDIDFFLIYKPKEIVSGDFYWFANPIDLPYVFVAITDCTGHGVPGAFMSMIGTRLLNSIVNEKAIYDPAEILEMMHAGVKSTLKQQTTGNMDGMDISLCRIEPVSKNEKKITFCGAKQSIFFYRKSTQKITKVRGDIKTIGGLYYDDIRFNNKVINLNSGDLLYLTSDGLIDQNAPDRKKFSTLRLIDILERIAHLPVSEQKQKLNEAYEAHRKDQPQRDDISFLGLRL